MIKVAIRVRPFNQRQISLNCQCCVEMQDTTTRLKAPQRQKAGIKTEYSFDYSFWSHSGYKTLQNGLIVPLTSKYYDQTKIFNEIGKQIINDSWQGYNSCLFAYGQTGAGKSYSMLGYGLNKGIVPLTFQQMFKRISQNQHPKKLFTVTMSMIEIYNEKIQDLLIPAQKRPISGLEIRENKTLGVYVQNITKHTVSSYKEIEKWMDEGTRNRSMASTLMNQYSSRAHTIISLQFVQMQQISKNKITKKTSMIHLIDLAGSERVKKTGLINSDRLKQAGSINTSLHVLGKVIEVLAQKSQGKKKNEVVPYRQSCLTKILQNSLGGNSRTIMICAISPATDNYQQSLSTLRYADQVKKIKNTAIVNQTLTDKVIRQLRQQNEKLKDMIRQFNQKSKISPQDQSILNGAKKMQKQILKQLNTNKKAMQSFAPQQENQQNLLMDISGIDLNQFDNNEVSGNSSGLGDFSFFKIDEPYITNLNEDQILNGKVKYNIEDELIIGRKNGKPVPKVILGSPGIQANHARIFKKRQKIYIQAYNEAASQYTFINGENVNEIIQLFHNDRIIFGSGCVFVLKTPNKIVRNNLVSEDQINYQFAISELQSLQKNKSLLEDSDMIMKLKSIEQEMEQEKKRMQQQIKLQKMKYEQQIKRLTIQKNRQNQLLIEELKKREEEQENLRKQKQYIKQIRQKAKFLEEELERERRQKQYLQRSILQNSMMYQEEESRRYQEVQEVQEDLLTDYAEPYDKNYGYQQDKTYNQATKQATLQQEQLLLNDTNNQNIIKQQTSKQKQQNKTDKYQKNINQITENIEEKKQMIKEQDKVNKISQKQFIQQAINTQEQIFIGNLVYRLKVQMKNQEIQTQFEIQLPSKNNQPNNIDNQNTTIIQKSQIKQINYQNLYNQPNNQNDEQLLNHMQIQANEKQVINNDGNQQTEVSPNLGEEINELQQYLGIQQQKQPDNNIIVKSQQNIIINQEQKNPINRQETNQLIEKNQIAIVNQIRNISSQPTENKLVEEQKILIKQQQIPNTNTEINEVFVQKYINMQEKQKIKQSLQNENLLFKDEKNIELSNQIEQFQQLKVNQQSKQQINNQEKQINNIQQKNVQTKLEIDNLQNQIIETTQNVVQSINTQNTEVVINKIQQTTNHQIKQNEVVMQVKQETINQNKLNQEDQKLQDASNHLSNLNLVTIQQQKSNEAKHDKTNKKKIPKQKKKKITMQQKLQKQKKLIEQQEAKLKIIQASEKKLEQSKQKTLKQIKFNQEILQKKELALKNHNILQERLLQYEKKLKEEEEYMKMVVKKQKIILGKKLVELLPQITEFNLIAKEMQRSIQASIKLSYGYTGHYELSQTLKASPYVSRVKYQILITNLEQDREYYWDFDQFKNRLCLAKDMLQIFIQDPTNQILYDRQSDPLWDPPQFELIGQSFLSLQHLLYNFDFISPIKIIGNKTIQGEIFVKIYPTDIEGKVNLAASEDNINSITEPKNFLQKDLNFNLIIQKIKLNERYLKAYIEYEIIVEANKFEKFATKKIQLTNLQAVINYSQTHAFREINEKMLDFIISSHLNLKVFCLKKDEVKERTGPSILIKQNTQQKPVQQNFSKGQIFQNSQIIQQIERQYRESILITQKQQLKNNLAKKDSSSSGTKKKTDSQKCTIF